MPIIAIAVIGTISLLGVAANMDDDTDEHTEAEENEPGLRKNINFSDAKT